MKSLYLTKISLNQQQQTPYNNIESDLRFLGKTANCKLETENLAINVNKVWNWTKKVDYNRFKQEITT